MNSFRRHIARPLAIVLIFLVGFASIGVSMDRHICQGKVKSMVLFGRAKSCLELEAHKPGTCKHHRHKKHSKSQKPCCHNEASYTNLPVQAIFGSAGFISIPSVDVLPAVAILPPVNPLHWKHLQEASIPFAERAVHPLSWDIYALFENYRL